MSRDYNLHPDDRPNFAKRLSPLSKVFFITILLILPLVLLGIFLKPLVMAQGHMRRAYELPRQFSEADLLRFLQQLALEDEFKFYFLALGEEGSRQAVVDIYPLLVIAQDKEALRQLILKDQSRVERMARDIKTLDYPSLFSVKPLAYPHLVSVSWDLIYEEFKATLLAVVYQAHYGQSFFFFWNNDAREAAYRVRRIVESLDGQERPHCQQFFLKILQTRPVSSAR